MPAAASVRSKADLRRENRQLHTAANQLMSEEASARAVAKAQWPQWAVAALSAVVSLVIAGIGAVVALSGDQFGAQEDRARESREKRAQIYADYLTSARGYRTAERESKLALRVGARLTARAERRGSSESAKVLAAAAREEATRTTDKASTAEAEWLKQADLVYVYGSDTAWAIHTEFQRAMSTVGYRPDTDELLDPAAGDPALTRFQAVFCREASATPREGCK